MILEIPSSNDPYYTQRSDLEGREYVFVFLYSIRESCWYLNLKTGEEEEIISGVKLVCNQPLLRNLAGELRPPGELMVISKTLDDSPPTLEELVSDSGRCTLIYVELNADE